MVEINTKAVAIPVVGTLAAVIVAYYYSKPKPAPKGYREIPTPKSGYVPFLGHLLSLGEMPANQISKWQKECNSSIIQVYMGSQPWVVMNDPFVAQDIFVKNGSVTSGRPGGIFGSEIHSQGRGLIFANITDKWKKTRGTANLVLAPKHVDDLGHVSRHEAGYLVDRLVQDTKKNEAGIDPDNSVLVFTLNYILTTCYAKRLSSDKDPLFKKLRHLLDRGMKYFGPLGYIGVFVPALAWVDVIQRKTQEMKQFIKEYRDDVISELIKDALAQPEHCFVKDMYKLKEQQGLTDMDIIVTLADLMFAGADTVSVSTSWVIAILCHYPDTQKRISEEVDAFIKANGRLPTFSERDHLPYTISVMKECLRFRPTVAFIIPHRVTKDFEYDGYLIPEGTIIIANGIGLHRNPDVYEEPEKFIPDRFYMKRGTIFRRPEYENAPNRTTSTNNTITKGDNGHIYDREIYVFGWGRRMCPGSYVVESELFNFYVALFSRCTIEPAIDKNGNAIYPDLDKIIDKGASCPPSAFRVRFVERTDKLV